MENQRFVIFGHFQKLKIIKITDDIADSIKSGSWSVAGAYYPDWVDNQDGEVYQGIFDNIRVLIDGEEQGGIEVEDMDATSVLNNAPYLVFYETAKVWLAPPDSIEDLSELQIEWDVVEVDEDSESYIFGTALIAGTPLSMVDYRAVDEGFFLVDQMDGIVALEIENDEEGFTLSAD